MTSSALGPAAAGAGSSGWITAGIPLYISFLTGFDPGPERIQALIALQVLVGLIFLVFGVTGITRWTIIFNFCYTLLGKKQLLICVLSIGRWR